jgi:fatty acid/phospholipid biosynthesis enzyme
MNLAVDAMGGDFAPNHVVIGAAQTIGHLTAQDSLLLIGGNDVMLDSCRRNSISPTSSVIHYFPREICLDELQSKTLAQNQHSSITEAFYLLQSKEGVAANVDAVPTRALFSMKTVADKTGTALTSFMRKENSETACGSLILFINGNVMTGHEASGPEAIKNMILLAYRTAATNFYQKIKVALGD